MRGRNLRYYGSGTFLPGSARRSGAPTSLRARPARAVAAPEDTEAEYGSTPSLSEEELSEAEEEPEGDYYTSEGGEEPYYGADAVAAGHMAVRAYVDEEAEEAPRPYQYHRNDERRRKGGYRKVYKRVKPREPSERKKAPVGASGASRSRVASTVDWTTRANGSINWPVGEL